MMLSLAGMASYSCDGPEDNPDGAGGYPENQLYKPAFSKSKVLKNPLSGWVMYMSASSDVSYLDTEFYISELAQTVKVRDYATCCYIRTGWSVFNPADGVYAWRDPSSQLYKLIHKAHEYGLPVAFRIVVDGRDQRANTPQFVLDAGAKYLIDNVKYSDRKTPLPQDPVFQRYYEKFVTALAEDFNDPEKCAFIDGYGLGKWGEGHTVAYSELGCEVVDENTQRLKEEVMEWITKLYSSKFTNVPLVMTYHRSLGHPKGLSSSEYDLSTKALNIAINNGYILRSDAFGMNDYYGNWERGTAASWRFKRPIIMEGGWIVGQHSYWNDPAKYRRDHPEDVRKGEYDACKEAHVNMMDFRVGAETQSWFTNAFDLVQKFISEGGYRIYPDQVYLPAKVSQGKEVKISSRWRNVGWGYLPNNIPQWNYRYKVAFSLLNSQGDPVETYVMDEAEPSEWTDSKPFSYDFVTKVNAPKGKYEWGVAIVDVTKDNTPAIALAVNEKVTSSGWVKLSTTEIE